MAARLISGLALYFVLVDATIIDPYLSEPENKVTIYNSTYSTLEDIWPFAPTNAYYNINFRYLPAGWSLAEDTPDARIAIQMYNFGTDYVVLRDKIFDHRLNVVEGQLIIHDSFGVKANVTFPSCILIKKDTPASVERKPYETVDITNLITFNGRDFAMVNNADPRGKARDSCDPVFYALRPGWEVAADNSETKAVMISTRFQFSYICKVTASGQGYSVGFDGINEPTCKNGMLYKTLIDQEEVVAVIDGSCGAVMVSRPTWNPNTWTNLPSITNVYTVISNSQEHDYAVLDNTPAHKLYSNSSYTSDEDGNCCQNVAKIVPLGWELATSIMPGFHEAASQPWGTYCTGLSNKGGSCKYYFNSVILRGRRVAAVSNCDAKILIKRIKTRECNRDTCPTSSSAIVRTPQPVVTVTNATGPTRGVAGVTIPSVLAVFFAVACTLLF